MIELHRLFALFALLAIVFVAALAPAPALAAMKPAHCAQSGMTMQHGQQPVSHQMDASCCPAATPAALPAVAAQARIAPTNMPTTLPVIAALPNHDPRIEIRPPRA